MLMSSDQGSLVGGWRVVTTDHPAPSKLPSRGPSHATKQEALEKPGWASECARLARFYWIKRPSS